MSRRYDPPLVDRYAPDGVLVWLRLDDFPGDYMSAGDLRLVRCDRERAGVAPEWYVDEYADSELDHALHIGFGIDWDCPRFNHARWAIRRGLCPGQPFLVAIDAPEWYRCSYEYDEYDVNWTSSLIDRVEVPAAIAAARWARFLTRRAARLEADRRRRDDEQSAAETAIDAMDVWTGIVGDWGRVTEHIARLHGGRGGGHRELAEGRGPTREAAFDAMARRAMLRLPHLDRATVDNLPRRW